MPFQGRRDFGLLWIHGGYCVRLRRLRQSDLFKLDPVGKIGSTRLESDCLGVLLKRVCPCGGVLCIDNLDFPDCPGASGQGFDVQRDGETGRHGS